MLRFALPFALLTSFAASAQTNSAPNDQPATLTPCSTLKITGNAEYPPILWRDPHETGAITGLAREILEIAFEGTGITLTFEDVGVWARAQKEVRIGRMDMLAGAFITDDRQTWMDYILPAFTDVPSVIWTPNDSDLQYNELNDLKPHKGGTLVDNSFGQEFDQYATNHLNIDYNNSISNAFRMLEAGRYDYVVFELYQGKAIQEVIGLSDQVIPRDPPISIEGLYFTLSKASECNTPALQAFLASKVSEMIASNLFDTLLIEHTHRWAGQQK